MRFARGSEQYFDQHFAFNPEPPRFIGILRTRLGKDFGRREYAWRGRSGWRRAPGAAMLAFPNVPVVISVCTDA